MAARRKPAKTAAAKPRPRAKAAGTKKAAPRRARAPAKAPAKRKRVELGRVERGLERSLLESDHVPPAARAGLRALARGLDAAEARRDPELVATAGRAYFAALELNGLTAKIEAGQSDLFAELLAELNTPTAGADTGDEPHP